jgi:hypothetical protein
MLKRPSWAERRTVPTDRLPEQQLHKQVSPNEELIDVLSWVCADARGGAADLLVSGADVEGERSASAGREAPLTSASKTK